MNKNDVKLICFVLIFVLCLLGIYLFTNKAGNQALVYYENELILKIDLNINKNYQVKGYNGDVKIVVENGKIKVDSEISPYNLCSKQGYISKTSESIVCLPNKIIIKIASDDLDGVVS